MGRTDEGLDRTRLGVVVRGQDAESLDAALGPDLTEMLGSRTGRAVVCARLHPPTPVTREVLDHVVDALIGAGCTDVTVGSTLSAQDRDRGHRSVSGLARLAGLTGRTASGRAYEVADLGEDTIPAPVPPTSVLDGRPVSRLWSGADTRVVVGRAVTDLLETYAGCLDALTGVVPEVAGAEPADVVVDIVRHLPPTVCVIDATATSDGADGARLAHPRDTGTVVVTRDALLADTTLASLLGADRGASRLVERAIAEIGPPPGAVQGKVTAFAGITRPHPLAVEAARRATGDRRLERVLTASIGGPDDGATTDDPVLSAVRAVLTPAVAAAEDTDRAGSPGRAPRRGRHRVRGRPGLVGQPRQGPRRPPRGPARYRARGIPRRGLRRPGGVPRRHRRRSRRASCTAGRRDAVDPRRRRHGLRGRPARSLPTSTSSSPGSTWPRGSP